MKTLDVMDKAGKFLGAVADATTEGIVDGVKIGAIAGGSVIGGLPTII